MERYAELVRNQPCMQRLAAALPGIVAEPFLHARMVNTLSRMEYVGVRKMLKARHVDLLDLDGVMHIVEEATHALRLKKAAIKLLGGVEEGVRTYSAVDTLAGDGAEAYLQGVDRGCEELLASFNFAEPARSEANYLLSSFVIEIRAEAFYPMYEQALQDAGAPFSVRSILKDELRHLAEMFERTQELFGDAWGELMDNAIAEESVCFEGWVDVISHAAKESLANLQA